MQQFYNKAQNMQKKSLAGSMLLMSFKQAFLQLLRSELPVSHFILGLHPCMQQHWPAGEQQVNAIHELTWIVGRFLVAVK